MRTVNTIRYALPVLLLLVATTAFFAPVLFTDRTYFLRDLTYIFHPWKTFAAEMIQKGQMPLWNPYVYCGMPLAANWQSAIFYPFSLLFNFLPFPWALKLYQVLHVFLAGFFGYLAARHWGCSRWASAGFMFVLAYNGFIVTRLEFLSHLGTDIWLFAILLLLEWPALTALALSCAFLAGHQNFFLVLFAVAAYVAVNPSKKKFPGYAGGAVLAALIAACISAVQLIPTAELSLLSARVKGGLDSAVAMLYSVSLKNLAGLASPLLQAAAGTATAGERLQWSSSYAVGIVTTLCCIGGIIGKGSGRLRTWAFLMVGTGIVLAMGDTTPVYPWLFKHVVFFRFLRYPVQFMYLVVTGLSVLALLGLRKTALRPAVAALIAVELLVAGYAFQPVAPDDYFYRKSDTVEYLQEHRDGRFMLSPGMENDRRINSAGIVDAWQTARGYLYNLACVPYHIRNAYGFGEPLTISALEEAVQEAYAKRSPLEALPDYAELGVRHMLTRREMPHVPGYRLVATTPLFIYELAGVPGLFESLNGTKLRLEPAAQEGPGYRMTAIAEKQSAIVVRESWYPGFITYVDGKKVAVRKWKDLFRMWDIPAGRSVSYHFYRPASVSFGIIISVFTLCLFVLRGMKKLTARDRNDPAE